MKKIGQKNVLDCEQYKLVIYLNSVRSKVEELKRQQQAIQAELEKVIPSVLLKAFRGGVVVEFEHRAGNYWTESRPELLA